MIHEFSHEDRGSVLFKRLRASLEKRLQKLREQNDNTQSTDTDTAVRRGEIKAIKALLADMEEKKHLPTRPASKHPYL